VIVAIGEVELTSMINFAGCARSPHDEDQRIRTPAIRRKRAEGFPLGMGDAVRPATCHTSLINYSFEPALGAGRWARMPLAEALRVALR